MRPLQISETTTLSKVKGKKDKDGCSPVTGVASMTLVHVIEEASQSLGLHLMIVVVRDEAVLGATDTFAAEQGAQCVPLVGGLLHFIYV